MKCFVIMPFGDPAKDPEQARKLDQIYTRWIKPTVEGIKISDETFITCHRADKVNRPDDIISHIIENLVTSELVIADLTGKNANVFYELGVRHAVNNNTILIAEDRNDIPFDLRPLRTIVYKYDPEHMLDLKSSLEDAINEILQTPEKMDNPVRRFLYNREVDKLITQPIPPGYDVFKNVISEMTSLKEEVKNHFSEIRNIMNLITSQKDSPVTERESIALEFFEGVWKNIRTKSTYCARVVDGELFLPYSYHYDGELTGHYYNIKLIDKTLFGRFKWFSSDISGYFFLTIENENKLVGGWWYEDDIPFEVTLDISRMDSSLGDMTSSILTRYSDIKAMPEWANEYFERKLYKVNA